MSSLLLRFSIFRNLFLNSFSAKFQTTLVVCFSFFNKLSLGKKFIRKVERLNVKQRRSRWDGSYEPSLLDLCCLQKPIIIAYGSERVKITFNYSAITSFRHISIIPQPSEPRCLSIFLLSSEPGHSISYTIACAFTEDTNQPAHPRSRLIKSLQGTLGIAKDPKRLRADGKDSNQHARMHRQIWACNIVENVVPRLM